MTVEASQAIARLDSTFDAAGLDVEYLIVKPGTDAWVGPDSWFANGRCDVYVYAPGWTALPEPPEVDDGAARGLNRDWYWLDQCT